MVELSPPIAGFLFYCTTLRLHFPPDNASIQSHQCEALRCVFRISGFTDSFVSCFPPMMQRVRYAYVTGIQGEPPPQPLYGLSVGLLDNIARCTYELRVINTLLFHANPTGGGQIDISQDNLWRQSYRTSGP